MRKLLYISLSLIILASCNKSSTSPSSYSFKTAIDSLGLQFGKQYQYLHYTANTLYEQGFLTFNTDTSFVEILNNDTGRFHANILYTYDPNSINILMPAIDTIYGDAGGLKYMYRRRIISTTLAFPGKAYLAWCCYQKDSAKGNPNNYLPFAYYLDKFAPVFMGTYNDSLTIMPFGTTDISGLFHYSDDKIIILK